MHWINHGVDGDIHQADDGKRPENTVLARPRGLIERLLERVVHYSVGKNMESFYVVGAVEFAPRLGASFPLMFEFSLTNEEFASEIVCNPGIKVDAVEGKAGVYRCFIAEDPKLSLEVLRFLVHEGFPVNRIPLRLVPSLRTPETLELVYEMNPIVQGIPKLLVEIWIDNLVEKSQFLRQEPIC